MVIIKFPIGTDAFTLQEMQKTLQEKSPKEHFIFLREDVEWIDLPIRDLYIIKKEIEDAIRDYENMNNDDL